MVSIRNDFPVPPTPLTNLHSGLKTWLQFRAAIGGEDGLSQNHKLSSGHH